MKMYFVVTDDFIGFGYNEYSDIYTKKEDAINELKNICSKWESKWESREISMYKTVHGNFDRVEYKNRYGITKMVFKIIEREVR